MGRAYFLRCITPLTFAASILSSSQVGADSSFKVGLALPLSGNLAPMGQAYRKGVELFFSDHPKEISRLNVIYDDHQYDGRSSASSCQKFSSINKVDLGIVWGNTPSGICAPIAENQKTPMLLLSMNPDAKGREYVLTFGPNLNLMVEKILEWYRTNVKSKRPAAVSINLGNALVGVEMVKKGLNGGLVDKIVANEEQDFRSLIASLKQQRVDAILMFLFPDQALTFARQAKEQNFEAPILGGDVFADEAFKKQFTSDLPKLDLIYGAVDPAFVERLRARFGEASYFFESACGYAVMELVSRASKRAHPSGIIASLKEAELGRGPVLGLEYKIDSEFGNHFETGYAVYSIDGKMG